MTAAIELEVRLSVAAIEACYKAGIPHIVYSALDELPPEVRVPTYVGKAKGECVGRVSGYCSREIEGMGIGRTKGRVIGAEWLDSIGPARETKVYGER